MSWWADCVSWLIKLSDQNIVDVIVEKVYNQNEVNIIVLWV